MSAACRQTCFPGLVGYNTLESFDWLWLHRSFNVCPGISCRRGSLGLEIKISFYLMIFLGVSLNLRLLIFLSWSSIEFKLLSLRKVRALSDGKIRWSLKFFRC